MAGPYSGYGAVLQVQIVATYTPIAAVRDISGPAYKTTAVDLSSRDARARQFKAGMYDAGEITFDILYDPDANSHAAAVAGGVVKLVIDGTLSSYKLLFPDTSPAVATFDGFITGFAAKAPMDGALTADLTIKIAGAITWT